MIRLIQPIAIILLIVFTLAQHDIHTSRHNLAMATVVDLYQENQQLQELVSACDDIALAKDLL